MTKLLTEVLQKVAELPAGRQDDAARTLLTLLENDARRYRLTDAQVREVELAMVEADSMENPHKPTDSTHMQVAATQPSIPYRDRDVVKAAHMILGHFPGLSKEVAYALLKSVANRKM